MEEPGFRSYLMDYLRDYLRDYFMDYLMDYLRVVEPLALLAALTMTKES